MRDTEECDIPQNPPSAGSKDSVAEKQNRWHLFSLFYVAVGKLRIWRESVHAQNRICRQRLLLIVCFCFFLFKVFRCSKNEGQHKKVFIFWHTNCGMVSLLCAPLPLLVRFPRIWGQFRNRVSVMQLIRGCWCQYFLLILINY